MPRYATTVSTSLSPAEAFAFMSDVRHFAEWDPGISRSVRVAGDGAAGSAYELTVAPGKTVMRYEVTACEAPRLLRMLAKTRFLTSVDEIRVEPAGTGALVTYDAVLTLNGVLGVMDPLLGIAFKRIGDRAAAGLKRALSRP
ncbi:MAG: SRPBCC family protein [Myxococcales bacterium]|nr:SRPBCC family protein [Myxococcales bacterium]